MGTLRFYSSIFLTLLVSFAAVSVAAEAVSLSENPVRFAVLGDRTGGPQEGIFEQIVIEAERLKPEFVMTVGDFIDGYSTDTAQLMSEWDTVLTMFEAFSVPIHLVAGNHDISYDAAEPVYRRYAGEPNYSFDHRGIHFTVLDNSRWEASTELPEDYITWLENDLKENRAAAYTFVFMHKPFWYKTTVQGFPDTLHTLFKAFGVDAVVTGHFHQYFAGEYDGIKYTSLGSSGGGTPADQIGPKYHFAWVTVDDKGIHLAPISLGSVLSRQVVAAEEYLTLTKSKYLGVEFTNPALIGPDMKVDRTTVGVVVRNYNPDLPIDDTIRWEVPDGWTVEPLSIPTYLDPGDSARFEFIVAGGAGPEVAPELALRLPLREGRSSVITKRLHVARQAAGVKADQTPALDGVLEETCWRGAQTDLLVSNDEAPAVDSTSFYFAFDSDNLYLAARCEDGRMDSVRAEVEERDGPVYSEDCVGYFIQPDSSQRVVYQVYFNPKGAVYDVRYKAGTDGYMNSNVSWDGAYEIGTAQDGEAWTIEVKIPLSQWGVEAESGQDWGINFRRKQARLRNAGDWQPISHDTHTLGLLRLR